MAPPGEKSSAKVGYKGFKDEAKEEDVRHSNIIAAKGVASAVRTSLGPKGMDKMIIGDTGNVIITNDGATILSKLNVVHPAAKMMVGLSKAQDVEAGDGTTSVVVLAGSLFDAAGKLLRKGIHPTAIAASFVKANTRAQEILRDMSVAVDLSDKETLVKSASTSLNSKVVSQHSAALAPIAVDAVLRVIDPKSASNVDLNDVRVVKLIGGTIDDTRLVDGLVFPQGKSGGPALVEDCKIALIQFCLSPPKSNIDNSVVLSDYAQMDRAINEERNYVLKLVQQIRKTGANVLLVQKSILRDAITDLSLQFLSKFKIQVISDIERSDMEFVAQTIGATPVATPEGLSAAKLGSAKCSEVLDCGEKKVVQIVGVPEPQRTVTIFCRGSNQLVLDECERSVHDALCVVRSIVKSRHLIPGGGAPEIELSIQLSKYADSLTGSESACVRAFAEAMDIIPYTLAENAGLSPIAMVTELRNQHALGEKSAGINVRKGCVTDILQENVLQPLLVSQNSLKLASELVAMVMKIDDIIAAR